MTTQPHAETFHQNTGGGLNRSPTSIQTHFTTPEFRTKVIEILSRTTNGCLQELNYHPGMSHKLAELQNRVNHFQEENKKLYEDNKRLSRMAKTIQEKQIAAERFYTGTIHSLEQQVLAMQRENQETLNREASLAAGHPEYARLQSEYARLQGCCTQLRQQIVALQKIFLLEKPPLPAQPPQQVVVSGQQNGMMAGGQSNGAKPSIPQSVQEALEKQQQQQLLARGQKDALPGRQIVTGQQAQAQTATSRQTRPHISIPYSSGVPMLNSSRSQPSTPNASSGIQSLMQANQVLLNHKTSVPTISRPSSSTSKHSNDIMEIDPQGFRLPGSKPVVHGWTNGSPNPDTPLSSIPTTANTTMHTQLHSMPPRPQASTPSALSGQNPMPATLPTSPSTPYVSPVNSNTLPGPRYPSIMINSPNIPVVHPQPPPGFGVNVVPIGPPGKLLPPLTASVVGPSSPSTSTNLPSFAHAPSISKRTAQASPSTIQPQASPFAIDLTNTPPTQPQAPSLPLQDQPPSPAPVIQTEANADHLQTPNLTPSSSRNSAVPSEGMPEVDTPLDVPVGHAFDVVGSPGTGSGAGTGTARVQGPVNMGKEATKHGGTCVSSEEEEGEITDNDEVSKEVVDNEAISLKRGSIHISDGDEEEGEIPYPEGVRKKPRLEGDTDVSSKDIPSDVSTATAVADGAGAGTANGDIPAEPTKTMDGEGEEDEDEEEEDEIGPDGLRTIKCCLDAFTDEDDNDVLTCVLCLKRHEEGLIAKPTTFSPDMTQDERLQHFLSEHLKVWEDFRHQRRFG